MINYQPAVKALYFFAGDALSFSVTDAERRLVPQTIGLLLFVWQPLLTFVYIYFGDTFAIQSCNEKPLLILLSFQV